MGYFKNVNYDSWKLQEHPPEYEIYSHQSEDFDPEDLYEPYEERTDQE